jgi:hypothetical protein
MNTGLGGHYHSLKATAEALSDRLSVTIIIIGNNPCPTIEKSGLPYIRIATTYNVIGGIISLIKALRELKPDVLHSFDSKADFFTRSASNYLKIPKINTKCGGAAPTKYYPYQKNLIIYSYEDLNYFSNSEKFKHSEIYLIPNRVVPINIDEKRIVEIKKKTTKKIIFLRISRIGSYYKKSIMQSMNLIRWLGEQGADAELILIGKVENEAILNELKELGTGANVTFITDPINTANASQLIDVADAVIGTGRGIMEAASRGKILLTPLDDSNYPVMVNKTNFDELFYYNFSERNKLKNYSEIENLTAIKETIGSENFLSENTKFINKIYNDHFSIQSKVPEYLRIYESLEYAKSDIKDYFVHLGILLRFYFK